LIGRRSKCYEKRQKKKDFEKEKSQRHPAKVLSPNISEKGSKPQQGTKKGKIRKVIVLKKKKDFAGKRSFHLMQGKKPKKTHAKVTAVSLKKPGKASAGSEFKGITIAQKRKNAQQGGIAKGALKKMQKASLSEYISIKKKNSEEEGASKVQKKGNRIWARNLGLLDHAKRKGKCIKGALLRQENCSSPNQGEQPFLLGGRKTQSRKRTTISRADQQINLVFRTAAENPKRTTI